MAWEWLSHANCSLFISSKIKIFFWEFKQRLLLGNGFCAVGVLASEVAVGRRMRRKRIAPNQIAFCQIYCCQIAHQITYWTHVSAGNSNQVTAHTVGKNTQKRYTSCVPKMKRKRRKNMQTCENSSASVEVAPDVCHVFASSFPSSKQTHAAAGAHVSWSSSRFILRNIIHHRRRCALSKKAKCGQGWNPFLILSYYYVISCSIMWIDLMIPFHPVYTISFY